MVFLILLINTYSSINIVIAKIKLIRSKRCPWGPHAPAMGMGPTNIVKPPDTSPWEGLSRA